MISPAWIVTLNLLTAGFAFACCAAMILIHRLVPSRATFVLIAGLVWLAGVRVSIAAEVELVANTRAWALVGYALLTVGFFMLYRSLRNVLACVKAEEAR